MSGHYIMIKASIQQEELTILYFGAPKYKKQVLVDQKGNRLQHNISWTL
jgi:uncharacterized protein (DUF302 family)